MKKQVPVGELQFGVYIHALDRPWTETPFVFQGFVLNNDEQMKALKQYCKSVFIDLEKGTDIADKPPESGPVLPSVLETIKVKTVYEERAEVTRELPVAREAHNKTLQVMHDVASAINSRTALDAPRIQAAVENMTESVVRNPGAMLLLERMKKKDPKTLDRALGVSIYMITFGRFLSLPREQLDLLGMLGLLQDIGKLRLPGQLLLKANPLTKAERMVCSDHVRHSVAILRETPGLPPGLPELAALHHERIDGSGYPKGLKGPQIGLIGCIAGLIDSYDAMTETKPYRDPIPPAQALQLLYAERGTKYDGPLVEQFIQCIGTYPVGAVVELHSGEIGIVIARNPKMKMFPRVMVILNIHKDPIKPPKIVEAAGIKKTLPKGSIDIDPSEYFL